jgi:hypothetical protein
VYWFSYARTEEMARKEAEHCLAAIKPYKLQFPVAFDFEYDSVNNAAINGVTITTELATAMCHAFCEVLDPDNPPRECGIWQYSSPGKVSGIDGDVDLDAAYQDYPAVIEAAGLNKLKEGDADPDAGSGATEPEDPYKAAYEKLIAAGFGDVLVLMAEKI